MGITHIGKIGRLPKCTRDELGRRIEDGELGKDLVKWLNGLSGVQEILKEQFGGRAVTEQNLSEWKQTGHPEWLRHEEARLLVSNITEQHGDLDDAADGMEISDRYAGVLVAKLVALTQKLLDEKTDDVQSWQFLREVLRELSQLRRDDHRAVRTMIKRNRWNREVEHEDEEEEKRMEQESKERLRKMCFSVLQNKTMADLFGGGEPGKKMAEMLHRIEFDLPLDDLVEPESAGKNQSDEIQPNPTPSNPIQPHPTPSNLIQPNPTE